jgi:hypothetical protein
MLRNCTSHGSTIVSESIDTMILLSPSDMQTVGDMRFYYTSNCIYIVINEIVRIVINIINN